MSFNLAVLIQRLQNLRRLDVTGSKNLRELPDLSTAMNFQELIIQGCKRLQNIPESISGLHNLTNLNAIHCCFLRNNMFEVRLFDNSETFMWFPNEARLSNFLKNLSIEGRPIHVVTFGLGGFGLGGNAEHLSFDFKQQIPDQSMTIEEEPRMPHSHVHSLKSLEIKQFSYLNFGDPFRCLTFRNFPYLTELKLINLSIEDIPEDISHLQFLETLDLEGNNVRSLPQSLGQLPKLKYLSLRNCRELEELPQLTQVETLILSDCNLPWLLELQIKEERATYCLLELWLDNCKDVYFESHYSDHFTNLTYLNLSSHYFEKVPSSIRKLSSLETLCLNNCKTLVLVEALPLSLKHLYAHGCDSLESVSLSPNHSIKHFDLGHCPRLNQEEHEHLMDLFLDDGNSQEVSLLVTTIDLFSFSSNQSGYFLDIMNVFPFFVGFTEMCLLTENWNVQPY